MRSLLIPFAFALLAALQPAHTAERPNIVFFLVDDLGWADLSCYGSTFHETPHLDALAASGMRFTQGYAAASICSPTRASLVTGRHPVRVDITDWIPGRKTPKGSRFLHIDDRNELALEEVTLAEALGEAGYRTFFAGKWHLGSEGFLPTDQGFEINIGGHHRGSPPGGYYAPWKNPYLEAKEEGEYLTERLTEESVAFIADQREKHAEQPFLLYLSYYNVHTPIQPYEKRVGHYRDKLAGDATLANDSEPIEEGRFGAVSRPRQNNADYASMVAAVDDSVGAILAALEAEGIADNTVVCFFSDNGGLCTKPSPGPTSNLPLRSGKGWLYEGGIREPMIIRAPGVAEPGSVCNTPVVSMDFFPTLLELAGLPLQPEHHADGRSLVPLLKGGEAAAGGERDLVWHYPHYHGSTWSPGAAIRSGDLKLIEFYETDDFELYDLAADPGEKQNLAESRAAEAEALRENLRAWQERMGAKMPQPNPEWGK